MYFNVESDTGSAIAGYVIPDSFSSVATIIVRNQGQELLRFSPHIPRPEVVAAGMHESGICGFLLEEDKLPGLREMVRLELADEASRLTIYRRRPAAQVTRERIFRLETRLLSLWRLDEMIEPRFQAYYRNIERLGASSAAQLFLLQGMESSYISGRVNFKAFDHYITGKFKTFVLFRQPYIELAERLLVLKQLAVTGSDALGARETMLLKPAIAYFRDVAIDDERQLRRALRDIDLPVAAVLGNPYLKALTADAPDAAAFDTNIASALDILAAFEVVGVEDDRPFFLDALGEMTGAPLQGFQFPEPSPKLLEMVQLVESLPVCGLLVDQDLELYHYLREAHEKAAQSQSEV